MNQYFFLSFNSNLLFDSADCMRDGVSKVVANLNSP